jgi:hypothetical protein
LGSRVDRRLIYRFLGGAKTTHHVVSRLLDVNAECRLGKIGISAFDPVDEAVVLGDEVVTPPDRACERLVELFLVGSEEHAELCRMTNEHGMEPGVPAELAHDVMKCEVRGANRPNVPRATAGFDCVDG